MSYRYRLTVGVLRRATSRLVGRVERDLDRRAVEGLAPDQGAQGLVDVLDHRPPSVRAARAAGQAAGGQPIGRPRLPDRAARPARSRCPVGPLSGTGRRRSTLGRTSKLHRPEGPSACRHYLSPGVYVEEVEAGSRPIEGVGTAVAAFVGLAARGPTNTPTLVTNWSQFVVRVRRLHGGRPTSRTPSTATSSTAAAPPTSSASAPTAPARRRRAPELPSARKSQAQRLPRQSPSRPARAATRSRSRSASRPSRGEDTFKLTVTRAGQARGDLRRRHTQAWQAERRDRRQGAVEAHPPRGGRPGAIERAPAVGTQSALAGGERQQPDAASPPTTTSANSADRTGFGGLEAVDEVTMLAVPDLMACTRQGVIDIEGLQAVQLGDDRPLRADGRPGRHPRRAARPQRPAGQGVAGRQGRLRLQVRDRSTGRGSRSSTRSPARRRSCRPSGHVAGVWARNDDTRGVHKAPANEVIRGRDRPGAEHHQGRARPAQPERHQLHPRLPRPRASASGAPGRSPATRRGATSTSGGSSTTSRSRSSRAPSGSSSSPTTSTSGSASSARSTRSSSGPGATARSSGRRPAGGLLRQVRRREQPARGDRRRPARRGDRDRPGQARRVRGLPHRPVLRRRVAQRIGGDRPCLTTDWRIHTHASRSPLAAARHARRASVRDPDRRHRIAQFPEVSGLASEIEVVELKENTRDGQARSSRSAGGDEAADDHPQARAELVQGPLGLAQGRAPGQGQRAPQERLGDPVELHRRPEVARYNFTNAWVSKITARHAQGRRQRGPDGGGLAGLRELRAA